MLIITWKIYPVIFSVADFRVINEIFSKVDHHIEKGDLLREFNMSALPNLYDQFVQLIEYLVKLVLKIALHWTWLYWRILV